MSEKSGSFIGSGSVSDPDRQISINKSTEKVVDTQLTNGNNPYLNAATQAVAAGMAATAKKYALIDNANAPKDKYTGAFPYDNDKSVFYH